MTRIAWLIWIFLTLALCVFLGLKLVDREADKRVFLPGDTSAGHYQIELACNACHTSDFADKEAIQEACTGCHGDALKTAKDDHPKSKFTDPRNADRIAVLDARYCATCHIEHRPEITLDMGLTVTQDVCVLCHSEIAEDRPSHEGMAFTTCSSAGCHNFHDNRAIYEDFLAKHLDEEATRQGVALPQGNFLEIAEFLEHYPKDEHPIKTIEQPDWLEPAGTTEYELAEAQWHLSSHKSAGVNCGGCHQDQTQGWVERPSHEACQGCHVDEVGGFLRGKHGMRLDAERLGTTLPPMQPKLARLPMQADAADYELSCQSCHAAHSYDAVNAAVESCLTCHADEHSLAYESSPHAALWRAERQGDAESGTSVTCATCHMPRIEKDYMWGAFTHNLVDHNQSATLKPNEKMIRPVCMQCHGLGFSIDALADRDLIDRNFAGQPSVHVESMDLARKRL